MIRQTQLATILGAEGGASNPGSVTSSSSSNGGRERSDSGEEDVSLSNASSFFNFRMT